VSTIVANGLEYSVTSSNDDHFDLDAAVESGYVKASTGPQVKGGGKLVTVLSPKEPRVIGAIFADDLLIADLKKLVMKGNVLHASGKSQVNFSLRGTGILGNLVEVPVVQLPDGSIAFDQGRLTSFGDEFKSRLRQFGVVTGLQIDHPSAMGGTIARPTDSNPASGSAIASLDFDTTFVLRSGRYRGTAVSLQNGGFRTRNEVGGAEWSLTDNADGSFKVLKRLDGREVLLIRITRREGTNDIGESSIVIRVQDGDHHDIGTAFSRRLSEISSSGTTFESDLEHAGVYTVIVSRQVQARAINDASIRSQLRVEANLLPMHKSDLQ
jgi:hypothetical protein